MEIQKVIASILFLCAIHSAIAGNDKQTNDSITLNQVIVTGTQISTNVNNIPASVTVVSRKELEKTEESSVLSALRGLVPGLFITERGTTGFGVYTGSAGGISLRGIGGSPTTQVLIAIDGHPQIMGINGHDLPDAYVAYNAENIEVVRGPASTVYGSNAMGGVINIITREEKTDGFRANGSMIFGSYNTQKYMLSLRSKRDRLSGFFSANYDKTDGYRDHSDFYLFNGFGKLGYSISDHFKTTADFNFSKYRSTDPGPITNPAISDSLTADITRGMAAINLDNHFQNTSGKVNLYYDFGHHEIYDGWQSDDISAGILADQTITPFKGSIFTLGLDYKMYGGKAIRTNNPNFNLDKVIHETALYLLGRQNLLQNKLTLDAGIRIEMNSLFGDEWVPKIGLSYRPKETSILKLSTAKGFRNPTMRELYVYAANENLDPESMMNYEISYTQFSSNKRFRGEMAVYLSKGKNMIQTIVNSGVPQFFNTGSFKNKGIEMAVQYHFPIQLNIYSNYSYIQCEKPILATPEHQINTGADYSLGKMNLMVNLQNIRNYYLKVGTTPVKENFALLDAKLSYKLLENLNVFCKADNLLNSSYQMNYNYPMPGTTIMGGFKVSL